MVVGLRQEIFLSQSHYSGQFAGSYYVLRANEIVWYNHTLESDVCG